MFKIKKIHPMFTGVVTTATRFVGDQHYKTESGILYDTRKMDGMMNPLQRVVSVGNMVKDLKEGDIVCIDFSRYAIADHRPGKIENNVETDQLGYKYSFPVVNIDGQECLFLQNNDITYYMCPEQGDCEIDDGGLLQ